jgi:hypothetical protein
MGMVASASIARSVPPIRRKRGTMPLTDEERDAIAALALPVPVSMRGSFLKAIADKLDVYPQQARGPGPAYQIAIATQRDFLKGGPKAIGPGTKFVRGGKRRSRRP